MDLQGFFYIHKMRDTMIIYRSFYEAIKELPKENQADIWSAVYELGLNGQEIDLQGISKTIFTLIKPQIDANLKRFENGKKPKVKKNISETEAKQEQNISETEANNNNNNNNNKNTIPSIDEFVAYALVKVPDINKEAVRMKYFSWVENDWSTNQKGKQRKISNWKATLNNTLVYLPKEPVKEEEGIYAHFRKQGLL
jgi:hypothetical protein